MEETQQDLPEPLQRILAKVRSNKDKDKAEEQNLTSQKKNELLLQSSDKCDKCGGTGVVCVDKDKRIYKRCTCVKNRILIERLNKSGLSIHALKKTFKNFNVDVSPEVSRMKDVATGFAIVLPKLLKSGDKHNSLALLGQSGAGKTHLLIATVNVLIKKNIDMQYFSYPEIMTYLKQHIMDVEYEEMVKKYKKCQLLVVDDLFKNGSTEADKRIMFEILNNRVINSKPIAISSELTIEELCQIDEAMGGRIKEMTDRFRYEIVGSEHNYRLNHNI